jgi:hypothetical protein
MKCTVRTFIDLTRIGSPEASTWKQSSVKFSMKKILWSLKSISIGHRSSLNHTTQKDEVARAIFTVKFENALELTTSHFDSLSHVEQQIQPGKQVKLLHATTQ